MYTVHSLFALPGTVKPEWDTAERNVRKSQRVSCQAQTSYNTPCIKVLEWYVSPLQQQSGPAGINMQNQNLLQTQKMLKIAFFTRKKRKSHLVDGERDSSFFTTVCTNLLAEPPSHIAIFLSRRLVFTKYNSFFSFPIFVFLSLMSETILVVLVPW